MPECYGNSCDGGGLPCIWCDAPAVSMSDVAAPEDGPDVLTDDMRVHYLRGWHDCRRDVLTALLNARDRRPFALWSLAKVIALVDEASR